MINKITIILGLIGVITVSCTSSENKTSQKANALVKGIINNGVGSNLYFEELSASAVTPLDTVKLEEDGSFNFGAEVNSQGFYRLKLADNNFIVIILQKGETVNINADAQNLEGSYDISGSEESERLQKLNRFMMKLYVSNDSLARAIKQHQNNRDVNNYVAANNYQSVIVGKRDSYVKEFVKEKPGSLASLAAVENLNPDSDFEYFNMVVKDLEKTMPESQYYLNLKSRVAEWGKLAIGSEAPDISLPSPEGKTIALSSLRGNVVLIDFWASWCRPCRMENPNVVKLYNKYHKKGFDIFSVSLDKSQQAWINAIQQDGLTWTHVSDLQHWQDQGIVLKPGRKGSWDDLSIWSGNAYRENGKYYLFYTGRNRRDGWPPEKTQRIGLATSTDHELGTARPHRRRPPCELASKEAGDRRELKLRT